MSLQWFVLFYLLFGLLFPQILIFTGKPVASFEIESWGIKSDGDHVVITNWRKHLIFRALAMICWGPVVIWMILLS